MRTIAPLSPVCPNLCRRGVGVDWASSGRIVVMRIFGRATRTKGRAEKLHTIRHYIRAIDLANDLSLFITGNLYSRTVLTLPERQMAACAMLAALGAADELKLHVNAALNVGCDPKKLAEVFFQLAPYGGMPLVNKALEVFRDVLKGRGEWESFTENR